MRIGECDFCGERRYVTEGKDSFGIHVLDLCAYGCDDLRSNPNPQGTDNELDSIATCEYCGKVLKPEMQLVYIEYFYSLFCSSGCSSEYQYEMIRSESINCEKLTAEELSKYNLKVMDGRLYR